MKNKKKTRYVGSGLPGYVEQGLKLKYGWSDEEMRKNLRRKVTEPNLPGYAEKALKSE